METAERRLSIERWALCHETDIVAARRVVHRHAAALGLSLVEQTKIVTAASELARNALVHGGGGSVTVDYVESSGRRGVRVVFEDQGPGIADIPLALTDGYTSGNGLGLGLGGAKRLVDDFVIESVVGRGTRVTIVRWR